MQELRGIVRITWMPVSRRQHAVELEVRDLQANNRSEMLCIMIIHQSQIAS